MLGRHYAKYWTQWTYNSFLYATTIPRWWRNNKVEILKFCLWLEREEREKIFWDKTTIFPSLHLFWRGNRIGPSKDCVQVGLTKWPLLKGLYISLLRSLWALYFSPRRSCGSCKTKLNRFGPVWTTMYTQCTLVQMFVLHCTVYNYLAPGEPSLVGGGDGW